MARPLTRAASRRLRLLLRGIVVRTGKPGGHDRARHVRVEAVASEDRVGPLAPRSGVRNSVQRPGMAREEPPRRVLIGRYRGLAGLRNGLLPIRQGSRDRLGRDPLLAKLHPKSSLAAWAGTIPRLDPLGGERLVVKHPEVAEPADGGRHEVLAVAGLGQPPADLGDGAVAGFKEAQRGIENDRGILDLAPPGAGLCRRLATPPVAGSPVR